MKIIVTGAAGFIGFHLIKRLAQAGHSVVGIDNLNNYYDIRLKYGRLKELGVDVKKFESQAAEDTKMAASAVFGNFRFAKIDITDLESLSKLFEAERFEIVVNLAAQAGVRYSIENPHAYVQSNIVGFLNVLECCRHCQVKHLVYASSSAVYGNNQKVPFSEDDKTDHPVSLYAATKKSNELMAHAYSHLYKLPTTGLRFFTVYGPWGRPDMSPMLFSEAITKGEAIKVFNNGDMERDFTYVDDIVAGVEAVMGQTPCGSEDTPFYRILNIGNSRPVKLIDFISTLATEMGREVKMEMMPMQAGDVKRTFADTTNLNLITGYRPSTSLQSGIREFVKWFRRYK